MSEKVRVAILGSHIIPYRIPFYRELATNPEVESLVVYGSDYGLRPARSRMGGEDFVWNVNATGGYPHVFVPNRSPKPDPSTFIGKINPGLWVELRKFRPDALVLSGYWGVYQLQVFAGAKALGIPVFYTADTNSLSDRGGTVGAFKSRALRRWYAGMSGVLVPGTRSREHYERHGVPKEKMFRFPLSVDNEHFMNAAEALAPERMRIRAEWGIDAETTCVLSISRLAPRKNIPELIRAVAAVPKLHLMLAGGGPEEASLKRLADELLLGRHTFIGFLNYDEVPRAYVAADFFASSSSYEPWGLTCNEAMCFGLPMVLSDRVGAAPDVLREGETGVTYPSGDVQALTRALEEVAYIAENRNYYTGVTLKKDAARFSVREQHRGLVAALRSVGLPLSDLGGDVRV